MIRWLMLFLWLPVAALAQAFPAQTDRHVNDFAGVLQADDASDLQSALQTLEAETGVQVVIVTVRRRADYGDPQTVEDWATNLFNTWGIGSAAKDDGILVLVGIEDREMRIALGAGYGPEFDAAAQRVVDNAILPPFREESYAQGLIAGVKALRTRIVEPFLTGNPPPEPDPVTPEGFPFVPLAFGGLFLALVSGISARRQIGDFLVRIRSCPSCGQKTLKRTRAVKVPPSVYTSGVATVLTVCKSCGNRTEREVALSKTGSKSSRRGGGSGGSRGRSSGGGASGRW